MIEHGAAPVILMAMKGSPGAGKSTLARALGRHLGWPLIDKDDVKDMLDQQTPLAGALSYEVMLRVVRRQALQGLSTIADSPLLKRSYDGMRSIAAETGAKVVVVECRCGDEAVWRERITARQRLDLAPHHTTTWDAVQRFLHLSESDYVIDDPHLTIDTARPLAQCMADVLAWLNEPTTGASVARNLSSIGQVAVSRPWTGDGER